MGYRTSNLTSLSRDSGISVHTLKRKFNIYLEEYTTWLPQNRAVHLVVDGTCFKNKIWIMYYNFHIVYWGVKAEHKELYQAYNGIKRALPSMFHYLDNYKTSRTINPMEGYFSHLKADIKFHRGLSKEHFRNFIRWYVYFKNNR